MDFVQITDLHLDTSSTRLQHLDPHAQAIAVLDDVAAGSFRNAILTGDIAESDLSVQWIRQELQKRQIDPLFCFGNHDLKFKKHYANGGSGAPGYFGQEIAGNLSLFLDSSTGLIDSGQLAWIERSVAGYDGRLFLFTHYPILDCGNTFMDRHYPLQNRAVLAEFLDRSGLEVVIFCGHYHAALQVGRGRIVQYLTPSTLYQIKLDTAELEIADEPFGYRVITISESGYSTHLKSLAS